MKTKKFKVITLSDRFETLEHHTKLLDKHVSIIDRKLNEELDLGARVAIALGRLTGEVGDLKTEVRLSNDRIAQLEKDVKSMMPEKYNGAPEPLLTPNLSWGTCVNEIKYPEEEKSSLFSWFPSWFRK